MAGALLNVEHLSVAYRGKRVVQDVSLQLDPGKVLVIAGESGSGKSTILKAVQGLLGQGGSIDEGHIFLGSTDITHLNKTGRRKLAGETLAMIFQNASASFCPIRTIGAQIYESVREHKDWSKEEFLARATEIMERIHLPKSVLDEYPFRLSGGMGQRAGILAAMILTPKLILADEPTSALDTVAQASVVRELMELKKSYGVSFLLVTHHMGVAYAMADAILIMRKGQVVEYGGKEQIFEHPQEAYTKELIDAVPHFDHARVS